MAVSAYILVETRPGTNRVVAGKMSSVPGIVSAYPVTGPYDVISAISFKHLENMTKVILPTVQKIPDVVKTVTCIREDLE